MSVLALWDLIKIQWHTQDIPYPGDKTQWSEERRSTRLFESLALGLCLLALTQRLKYKDEQKAWRGIVPDGISKNTG